MDRDSEGRDSDHILIPEEYLSGCCEVVSDDRYLVVVEIFDEFVSEVLLIS